MPGLADGDGSAGGRKDQLFQFIFFQESESIFKNILLKRLIPGLSNMDDNSSREC